MDVTVTYNCQTKRLSQPITTLDLQRLTMLCRQLYPELAEKNFSIQYYGVCV